MSNKKCLFLTYKKNLPVKPKNIYNACLFHICAHWDKYFCSRDGVYGIWFYTFVIKRHGITDILYTIQCKWREWVVGIEHAPRGDKCFVFPWAPVRREWGRYAVTQDILAPYIKTLALLAFTRVNIWPSLSCTPFTFTDLSILIALADKIVKNCKILEDHTYYLRWKKGCKCMYLKIQHGHIPDGHHKL